MSGKRRFFASCFVSLICLLSYRVHGQVTSQRLAGSANEPQNWLTYSGNYSSTRYSPLTQITPANVKQLKLQWVYQAPVAGNWQTTPLVVDGIMYITQRLNDVVALDATTGRAFWVYRYTPAADRIVCCGANNRGLAILGDTLFMGTLDAHLIAIDAKTGRAVWKTEVASTRSGTRSRTRHWSSRTRSSSASAAASTASAASSPPMTRRRDARRGASTRFRPPASPVPRRGSAVLRPIPSAIPRPGNMAVDRSG